MRLSRYFLPVLKETPSEAQIASHRLMLRAGMIRQEAAGIYAWLPLGHRVLKKIEQIVREEQDRAGAVEMLMPTLQLAELWRESGRYDAYGPEMLRIRDRQDRDMLYGPTNEEMITDIFRAHVGSYKDLPLMEDVDLARRISRWRWRFLPVDAVTSAARYRRRGYLARVLRNASLLTLYFIGVHPGTLAALYED